MQSRSWATALLTLGALVTAAPPCRAAGGLVVEAARLHTPPDSHEPQRALVDLRNAGPEALTQVTVLCTFTLCSVRSPTAVLAEARRVLRPDGRFLFCEHGLSPDAEVSRWQRRLEPLWKRIAGGCHLTRPVASAVAAAGFHLDEVEQRYMPKTPRPLGWCEWGVARLA